MAKSDSVFIFIGTYPSELAAQDDYAIVKDLHTAGAVGTYDAAVVTKDLNGKVHVNKDEMATRHGGWGGAAVGAVVGILFPPSIIGAALEAIQLLHTGCTSIATDRPPPAEPPRRTAPIRARTTAGAPAPLGPAFGGAVAVDPRVQPKRSRRHGVEVLRAYGHPI